MAKFEVVSAYADKDIPIPTRGTKHAAGYDFIVAEDIIIPSYRYNMDILKYQLGGETTLPWNLDSLAYQTKKTKAKPTLVPTGIKCQLADDEYLELSVRSSTPLKYWLILANGVGRLQCRL